MLKTLMQPIFNLIKKGGKRWEPAGRVKASRKYKCSWSPVQQPSHPLIPPLPKLIPMCFRRFTFSYKLDTAGHNTLVLSYNERIRRPGYQQLNPFLFFHDQYTYSSGNPNPAPLLQPVLRVKYRLPAIYRHEPTGYWVGNTRKSAPNAGTLGNVFITSPYNFINNRTYSLVPYFSFDPVHWWTVRINAVLLYILNNGSAAGVTINQKTNLHEIETSNELQLGRDWSAELDGFFPGKQSFGQSQGDKAGYNISGGIRKSILQGQGSISLNVNDLFNTLNFDGQTIGINQVSAFSTRQTDTRRLGIAFSYRFGKAANARKRNTNGSAEDEKGRTD